MTTSESPQPEQPDIPDTPFEMFPDDVEYHVENRVADMIRMGYVLDASKILLGPIEPEDLPSMHEPPHHSDEYPHD